MDIDGGFLHFFIASKSATNNFIPVFFPSVSISVV